MSSLSTSFLAILLMSSLIAAVGNFNSDVDITFGDQRSKILYGGKMLTLSLDKASGSGFKSKEEFLFGRFDISLKLVPGNSAGTVTTYYLSSQEAQHDEIDFEFLGNMSGDPYTVHTNVYVQGIGGREQQFKLWFDPTKDFHTYTLLWNPLRIMFMVDNIAIRVFKNKEKIGVPFPKTQAMRVYSSLWNADDWATRGGLVKTDWTAAPFMASYRDFKVESKRKGSWWRQGLDWKGRNRLIWVRKNFMTYDYCADFKRYPQGIPLECKNLKMF